MRANIPTFLLKKEEPKRTGLGAPDPTWHPCRCLFQGANTRLAQDRPAGLAQTPPARGAARAAGRAPQLRPASASAVQGSRRAALGAEPPPLPLLSPSVQRVAVTTAWGAGGKGANPGKREGRICSALSRPRSRALPRRPQAAVPSALLLTPPDPASPSSAPSLLLPARRPLPAPADTFACDLPFGVPAAPPVSPGAGGLWCRGLCSRAALTRAW